jgi:flagellar hook protein FlgE
VQTVHPVQAPLPAPHGPLPAQAKPPAGQLTLKEAGVGGAGQIASSNLEASTVDLSAEFTALIQTQKAYSASSKIITTADQMLEELLSIKR